METLSFCQYCGSDAPIHGSNECRDYLSKKLSVANGSIAFWQEYSLEQSNKIKHLGLAIKDARYLIASRTTENYYDNINKAFTVLDDILEKEGLA